MLGKLGRVLLLVIGSTGYSLAAGEFLYRFTDGYRFDVAELARRQGTRIAPADNTAVERALVEQTRVDRRLDPELFFSPPAVVDKPADPEIAARTKADPNVAGEENMVWNDAYLREMSPFAQEHLRRQKARVFFSFRSYDGSIHPNYRLYPDTQSDLGTTNHFGWLSPDIAVGKLNNTIRVAILGDSTSHNSLGLYLEGMLNAWPSHAGLGYRFEVINAARQGLGQPDFINILKYELVPVTPDYVLLTEASVVFFRKGELWTAKRRNEVKSFTPRPSWFAREARRLLKKPSRWSALAAHVLKAANDDLSDSVEREPPKPAVKLNPPFNLGKSPTLADVRSFRWYRDFLDALDTMNQISVRERIIPIITTDRACAYPGMAVNRSTNPYLFGAVNGPEYWPLSYRQIQRVLRFHNDVIAHWAAINGVNLIDIQAMMPKKVELCVDVQHDIPLGQRLRAWLMFQKLVRIIKADIAAGRVPRAGNGLTNHPAFTQPVMRLDRTAVIAGFKSALSK
jgi:hypothetical protein